jgi:hypothetical protein
VERILEIEITCQESYSEFRMNVGVLSEFRNITKRTRLDIWEDTSVGSLFARQPLGKASLTFWKNSKNMIQSTFTTKLHAKPFYDMYPGTDLLKGNDSFPCLT